MSVDGVFGVVSVSDGVCSPDAVGSATSPDFVSSPDKSVVPFESPESGTILKLLAEESDTLDIYEPIAIIGEPGENIDDLADSSAEEAADKPAAEENKTENTVKQ